jgi:hypothetical protein
MALLNLPIMKLYFTALPGDASANGNLVVKGMTDSLGVGDRALVLLGNGVGWIEARLDEKDIEGIKEYHPGIIKLPLKFQSKEARVTCPDCHLTYTHEHIFSVPVKS